MKLKQYHRSGFAIYEITDHSLKITSLHVADWQKHEVLLSDIRINDLYKIKENNRYLTTWIIVYSVFLWAFLEKLFFNGPGHWLGSAIFGALLLHVIILFFFPPTKVCIPAKSGGMIRLYEKKPTKKRWKNLFTCLKGK